MKKLHMMAGLLAMALAAPAAAQAYPVKYSWQGNDRSWNSTDGKTLNVCDGEDDGNHAEGQRWTFSGTRHVIRDDALAGCEYVTVSTVMYKHRVVEVRTFDAVGQMQYVW